MAGQQFEAFRTGRRPVDGPVAKIENTDDLLAHTKAVFAGTLKRKNRARRKHEFMPTTGQCSGRFSNCNQLARHFQARARIGGLSVHCQRAMGRVHRQPGLFGCGKSCRGRLPRPGKRGARAIASERVGPVGNGLRILQRFEWDIGLGQAQFLALVDEGIAPQAEQEERQQPGDLGGVVCPGPAGDRARRVMV